MSDKRVEQLEKGYDELRKVCNRQRASLEKAIGDVGTLGVELGNLRAERDAALDAIRRLMREWDTKEGLSPEAWAQARKALDSATN